MLMIWRLSAFSIDFDAHDLEVIIEAQKFSFTNFLLLVRILACELIIEAQQFPGLLQSLMT